MFVGFLVCGCGCRNSGGVGVGVLLFHSFLPFCRIGVGVGVVVGQTERPATVCPYTVPHPGGVVNINFLLPGYLYPQPPLHLFRAAVVCPGQCCNFTLCHIGGVVMVFSPPCVRHIVSSRFISLTPPKIPLCPSYSPFLQTFQLIIIGGYGVYDSGSHLIFDLSRRVNSITTNFNIGKK